jgi:hypothetical protein
VFLRRKPMRTFPILAAFLMLLGLMPLVGCPSTTGSGDDDDTASDDDDAANDDDAMDDDDAVADADCDSEPCGGDPVGVWETGATCAGPDTDLFNGSCDAAEFEIDTTGGLSTWTIEEGGDYSWTLAASDSDISLSVPTDCYTDLGAVECSQIGDAYLSFYSNVACVEAGASCDCTAEYAVAEQNYAGTWSVDATTVTFDDGSAPFEYEFCQTGDVMKFSFDSGAGEYGWLFNRQ